jgi:hypothetical protein
MQFDQLKRREFITLVGSAAAWPFTVRAQQSSRLIRLGFLGPTLNNPPAIEQYLQCSRRMIKHLIGFRRGRREAVLLFAVHESGYGRFGCKSLFRVNM